MDKEESPVTNPMWITFVHGAHEHPLLMPKEDSYTPPASKG